jgi:hypothetical protein
MAGRCGDPVRKRSRGGKRRSLRGTSPRASCMPLRRSRTVFLHRARSSIQRPPRVQRRALRGSRGTRGACGGGHRLGASFNAQRLELPPLTADPAAGHAAGRGARGATSSRHPSGTTKVTDRRIAARCNLFPSRCLARGRAGTVGSPCTERGAGFSRRPGYGKRFLREPGAVRGTPVEIGHRLGASLKARRPLQAAVRRRV